MLNQKLTGQQAPDKTYIEDVFSTYLYTGNGTSQTINNGIDLAGKGGLVWTKERTSSPSGTGNNHNLVDTVNGAGKKLQSNTTAAQSTYNTVYELSSFTSTGFTLGYDGGEGMNETNVSTVSWTFRKAPKFFDVVTYTGDGIEGRTIPHSLGVKPGMYFIKCTNASATNWVVWHASATAGNSKYLTLNSTAAAGMGASVLGNSTDTVSSSVFSVGTNAVTNASGNTYVAYLFAHDTTTDGLIQCGSYTGTGAANLNVTLGWEPQYVMVKSATDANGWVVFDNMRGMSDKGRVQLYPNTTEAEYTTTANAGCIPTATGFRFDIANTFFNTSGQTYIYMAIRRGPMRTPTDGTKVFGVTAYAGDSTANRQLSFTQKPVDTVIDCMRTGSTCSKGFYDRLRGNTIYVASNSTAAETTAGSLYFDKNDGIRVSFDSYQFPNWSSATYALYGLTRAPGFFDVVCYTGTGSGNKTLNHNLGVAPEFVIFKSRSGSGAGYRWFVQTSYTGTNFASLNLTDAFADAGVSGFTSTTVTAPFGLNLNTSASTYVAYLFATCPGVSKVGTYTGNGSSQTINCGFTNGARFVLIKRIDSTGDWYVWDTARGIAAASDPHLSLNTTAAEVTTDDTIDPDSTGFIVNQVAATNVNVNAATYIYLAIA